MTFSILGFIDNLRDTTLHSIAFDSKHSVPENLNHVFDTLESLRLTPGNIFQRTPHESKTAHESIRLVNHQTHNSPLTHVTRHLSLVCVQ